MVIERVGTVNVSGLDNEVRWEYSLQGDAPRIVNSGIKNVVTRATPTSDAGPGRSAASTEKREKPRSSAPAPRTPPAPAPTTGAEKPATAGRLTVTQSGQTLTLECASREVTVRGSTNTITLTGTCAQVAVSGTGNKITVERTPRIVTTGHNNEITWEQGDGDQKPSVRDSGMNNIVRRASL